MLRPIAENPFADRQIAELQFAKIFFANFFFFAEKCICQFLPRAKLA
jgi:hypothetical protein